MISFSSVWGQCVDMLNKAEYTLDRSLVYHGANKNMFTPLCNSV